MGDADTRAYRDKKAFFSGSITLYGRNPVLEALQNRDLSVYRLHLSESNRPSGQLDRLLSLASDRGVEVCYHGKRELSRISRNGKQDQGVALDVLCPAFRQLDDYLESSGTFSGQRLLAADGITNPQNAGMLIRSALAGGIDGILWPASGNAALGPLAVKASAGTLFSAPLLRCQDLVSGLAALTKAGFAVYTLQAGATATIYERPERAAEVFVLGGESEGISEEVAAVADCSLAIPMKNAVESLNVAVSAALIAYLPR